MSQQHNCIPTARGLHLGMSLKGPCRKIAIEMQAHQEEAAHLLAAAARAVKALVAPLLQLRLAPKPRCLARLDWRLNRITYSGPPWA